jgi:hypothetical protein
MTDVTVPFTGWGRAGFGELAWNEGSVAVGSATGEVGTVITVIEGSGVDVFVTGVSATGLVRPVLVWGRIVPDPGTVYTEITPSAGTIWTEIAA